MNEGKALFVALEGIDGSGTTTQVKLLNEWLCSLGVPTHTTHEPSTGTLGVLLRQALAHRVQLTEPSLALLFAADRLEHVHQEIAPKLASGHVVLSDRYTLSSLAYQSSSLPLDWVMAINCQARKPDLSILLRVDAAVAKERRQQRGGADELFDKHERQIQVARQYDVVFARADVGPTAVIDAALDVPTVQQHLRELIEPLLSERLQEGHKS